MEKENMQCHDFCAHQICFLPWLKVKNLGSAGGQREKIDWQEAHKFDCWLVQTIFIFCQFSQGIGKWLGQFQGQGKFWLGKTF